MIDGVTKGVLETDTDGVGVFDGVGELVGEMDGVIEIDGGGQSTII